MDKRTGEPRQIMMTIRFQVPKTKQQIYIKLELRKR